MNIFFIDKDPVKAAVQQTDKLVVKMTLETAQLLSTARRYFGDTSSCLYKSTHINHPSNIWIRESLSNYIWLAKHFKALCEEYSYRFLQTHKSMSLLLKFGEDLPELKDIGLTKFRLAMPNQYKVDDPVQSYRNYYTAEKIQNKHWTNRKKKELDGWLSCHLNPTQFKVLHVRKT